MKMSSTVKAGNAIARAQVNLPTLLKGLTSIGYRLKDDTGVGHRTLTSSDGKYELYVETYASAGTKQMTSIEVG
jgi:hypothetical protein